MKTIFVSSTFQDMHYERDIIHDQVTPALNAVARQYGESVSFCDLRWGVNTGELESEEGSRKVLSVCLEEIDRCRPYMLVILGDRYGWIPDQGLIADAASRARFALEELEQSVTALEIEYGALSNPEQLERTLFYFREFAEEPPAPYRSEDPHHAAKLEDLKGRIRKLARGRLKTYILGWDPEANRPVGLEQFAALVEADVRELMEQEWKEISALTPYQRDQRGQWDYAAQKARQFSAREDFVSGCISLLDGGTNLLAIRGQSGTGKSTLMARLAQVLQARGDGVLPIFCSTTGLCTTGLDLVKYMVHHLEIRLNQPHFVRNPQGKLPQEKEWLERLETLVAAYNTRGEGRLVVLIDAVDQLSADELRDGLSFVPYNLSHRVQMVLSCLEDFPLSRPLETRTLEPLSTARRFDIVAGILSFLGRELDKPVIDAMVQKPAAHSPLYLSLVVQRLTMMNKADFDEIAAQGDGMAAITRHQMELVEGCSDTLEGMCVDILSAASRRVGGPFVQTAAEYLAASRHGLRERDLEGLLTARGIPWSGLDFARFVQYLNTFFILREDGRYDFAHQSIRRGILVRCGDVQKLHREILAHLQTLDRRDGVRLREFGYHCILAGDFEAFIGCVAGAGDDEETLTFLARDAHDLAREDGGKWLRTLFRRGLALGVGHAFVDFVNAQLSRSFGDSQTELNLARDVLEPGLELAWQVSQRSRTLKSRRDLLVSYLEIGEIYQALGGRDNLRRGLDCFRQGLELAQALDREQGNADSRRDLFISYGKMGNLYRALGGEDNLRRGLEWLQKGQELALAQALEQGTIRNYRDLLISYSNLGNLYRELGGGDNLRRGLDCFQKALKLAQTLDRKQNTTDSRRDLYVIYGGIGIIYEELGDEEHLHLALESYQQALKLAQALDRELGTATSRRDLLISYSQIGRIYAGSMEDPERVRLGLEWYQKSVKPAEDLAREQGTAESYRDLYMVYSRLGDLCQGLGNPDSLRRGLDWYRKALDVTETLAREQGTAASRLDLFSAYNSIGVLYPKLGGAEHLQLGLEWLQKGLELAQALDRELGTATSRRALAISYGNLGDIYMAMGGAENLRRGLEWHQQGLELRQALYRTEGTAQSRRDLTTSFRKLGGLHRALGGAEHLGRALACYQQQLALLEPQAGQEESPASRQERFVCCSTLGELYRALGGRENLERARQVYQRGLSLVEAQDPASDVPISRRERAVSCNNLGDVLRGLGGAQNMALSLEMYRKGLSLGEDLVQSAGTVVDYDILATSVYQIAVHPATAPEDRQQGLERFLELARLLFDRTQNPRYGNFVRLGQQALELIRGGTATSQVAPTPAPSQAAPKQAVPDASLRQNPIPKSSLWNRFWKGGKK